MSPFLRLAPLLRGRGARIGVAVGASFASAGLQLVAPACAAYALDVAVPAGDRARLGAAVAAMFGAVVGQLALGWYGRVRAEAVAQAAIADLKRHLFARLLDAEPAWHDQNPSGKLVSRLMSDTEALRVLLTEVVLAVPGDLALFAGVAVLLARGAPPLAPVVLGVLVPYALLFALFRRVAPARFATSRERTAELTAWIAESVRWMPALAIAGRARWAAAQAAARVDAARWAEFTAQLQPVWYFNALSLVRTLDIVALLAVGSAGLGQGVTLGMLVLALGALRQLFAPLQRLSNHLSTLERARVAAARSAELLDRVPAVRDPDVPVPWPGLGDGVRLEGVVVRYGDTTALRGLSLHLPTGWRVGVVGETGAGKSTLASLLLRFRDPDEGRVTVGGVDLRALARDDLRRHVGHVPQDVFVFDGTVLDNLGGDRAAAEAALALLGVDLDLDAPARACSRGERQLLTFARAMRDQPPLLVLDEATAAVDPATEARVQAALARLAEGRTTLVVAHRLATVRGCDAIAVVADGALVGWGTHEALVAAGGWYARAWAAQSAGGAA